MPINEFRARDQSGCTSPFRLSPAMYCGSSNSSPTLKTSSLDLPTSTISKRAEPAAFACRFLTAEPFCQKQMLGLIKLFGQCQRRGFTERTPARVCVTGGESEQDCDECCGSHCSVREM